MNDMQPGPQSQNAALVRESTDAKFKPDVMDASHEALILVDFWAPWCAPCRQLGPALEKVVGEQGGSVRLVKINIDENQAIAGQLGVQSIPAVFAFRDGKPVDGFMGALPESEIRKFIEKNGGTGNPQTQAALEEAADELKGGDAQKAGALYSAIVQQNPEELAAILGLARSALALEDLDGAAKALELVPAAKQNDPEVLSLKAEIDLAGQSAETGDIDALRAAVDKAPDDHASRFDLAIALGRAGQREEAQDALLEIIRRDREWNDEAARKQLLKFFDAWGAADPVVARGRRKLSSVLFS